jgi:molybdopterin-guanine dinucleotide biosynthesis protein A
MSTHFGPVIDPLVAGRSPPLGAGRPVEGAKRSLSKLSPESLFPGRRIVDAAAARGCLAGLWLWNDWLEESHAVSQGIDTPEGSWWHAIMHRREGDFANAKYWFRRVGEHPLFPRLAEASRRIASPNRPGDPRHGWIATAAEWDPLRFVDLCEDLARRSSPDEELAREIAAQEWRLLFAHCHDLALGAEPTSAGIILAGGSGSRLGGVDKAMLQFEGQTFLARAVAAVAPSVGEIVVVAAAGQVIDPGSLAASVPVRVVRDTTAGAGPLAALADGLRGATLPDSGIAVIASCDSPRISPDVVRLLVESLVNAGEQCDWAVPEVAGHPQVLLSAIRTKVLPAIEAHLACGRRDVRGMLSKLRTCTIDEEQLRRLDPALASFHDIDTAEDLRELGASFPVQGR